MIAGANVQNVGVVCNTALSSPRTLAVVTSRTRIDLPVTMVGADPVSINATVDTGSAGMTLNAFDIFPASMVTSNGFVFPPGQTSLTYNGMTVTNFEASRSYGGQSGSPTTRTGNIGFAQITFDGPGGVTTAVVPILFIYQLTVNGSVTAPTEFANLIGVNPELGAVHVEGSTDPGTSNLTPCTPASTTTCGMPSPLRLVSYVAGLDEGFILKQVPLADCADTSDGFCAPVPALVVGLNSSVTTGFSTTALTECRPVAISGPATEPVCSQAIPNVTVSSGGASYTGPAIFDSGAPTTRLETPAGAAFPSSLQQGAVVNLATPSGFNYDFTVGGAHPVVVDQNAAPSNFTNSGVLFFSLNSLLVDYAMALEGWKSGS